jgi:regulatory protein
MQKKPISSEEIDEAKALSQAAALCSRREYCVSQMREKLAAWGLPDDARERVIQRLVDERFIDEQRFARAYAMDKMRYNHWGRVKISQMLRLMGIPAALRETALEELPADEYTAILQRLARQKRPALKARNDYELRGKLMRFLVGRGFEADEVARAIDDERLS